MSFKSDFLYATKTTGCYIMSHKIVQVNQHWNSR